MTRTNPMKHPERRKAFDEAVLALRKLSPNASDDWVQDMARRQARTVAVVKKSKPARRRVCVAQTYRLRTRAQRSGAHRLKMSVKYGTKQPNARPVHVLANLSRYHPDYGCTPAEHERRKRAA